MVEFSEKLIYILRSSFYHFLFGNFVLKFFKSSFNKVKNALVKTGSLLGSRIRALFSQQMNEETLEKLEQLFYESDLGLKTAEELTLRVKELHRQNPKIESEELILALKKELTDLIGDAGTLKEIQKEEGPLVILIVGVNGNGKTTTVAKLANYYQSLDKKVLIAGADTFRAAAMEQLELWAKKINVDIVKGNPKSDPAAVVFDAVSAAKARQSDVVIIDTAGRLHTKTPLMQELQKIKKTCQKVHSNSPHETLLVLDATTGQNAIDQAKTFHQFTPITGLILTKLDGTAKGGIVVSIQRELGIPVKFIGLGEGVEDLEVFHPEAFVNALFE